MRRPPKRRMDGSLPMSHGAIRNASLVPRGSHHPLGHLRSPISSPGSAPGSPRQEANRDSRTSTAARGRLGRRVVSLASTRKERAPKALCYHAIVQSWPEITRLARESCSRLAEQTSRFEGDPQ
jgi:hypothetical protein